MKSKIDGCKFCENNKVGYKQGYWCATNCISGSKFILKEKLRSQKLNVHENVNIIEIYKQGL